MRNNSVQRRMEVFSAKANGSNMTTTKRLFYLCELMSIRRLSLALYLGVAALLAATTPARAAEEKIWHVKAIHPEGRLLDVKAIDKQGKIHPVKAIQTEGNLH